MSITWDCPACNNDPEDCYCSSEVIEDAERREVSSAQAREEAVDLILVALDTVVDGVRGDGRRLRVENGIDALLVAGWRKVGPSADAMDHVGWACRHNPDDPDDIHTQWQRRRRKPGWKRKKLPGYVSSMSGLEWRPDAPTEPGCLAARPVYSPKESSDGG